MSPTADVLGIYLAFLLAVAAHEPWRWLGYRLGRDIDANSEVFLWVRAVATALVAALVLRIVAFPPGALAGIEASLRVAAFVAGLVLFYLARRSLAAGLLGGAGVLLVGKLLLG